MFLTISTSLERKISIEDTKYNPEKPISVLSYFWDDPNMFKTDEDLLSNAKTLLKNIKICDENKIDCLYSYFIEKDLIKK